MPLAVCDYDPCSTLQSALQKLVVMPDGAKTFQFTVIGSSKDLVTYYVPLVYCPFCGTRIEEEWIEAFLQKRSHHTL